MDAQELRQRFVLANAFKEGDLSVGGTRDDRVREEARRALLGTRLGEIRHTTLVEDGVSERLAGSLNRDLHAELDRLTVEQLRQRLLGTPEQVRHYRDGLSSEAIAAVVKVMTNDELSRVARRLFNPLPGDGIAVGSPLHFGSRIQPNSPGDDEEEILFSILEGLAYGCGDVIIGLNPASDELETIVRLESLLHRVIERLQLPTQYCVLSDLVKQHRAREHTPVDVGFQSLAGTSSALAGMIGLDIDGVLDLAKSFDRLYFETGQGSEVTNGTADDVDMVTLESRTYGVARYIRQQTGAWMIVNDVAGFIGPEVFRTPAQLERACLEDTVMAKLHGLTMGLDICATFHMGIAPDTLRQLTARIAESAAPAYLMAVAGSADPMLGYLTTSFREHPPLRRRLGRQVTSAMHKRLVELDVMDASGDVTPDTRSAAYLYAMYAKSGGDRRTSASLLDEGQHKIEELRRRGYDLGGDDGTRLQPRLSGTRLQPRQPDDPNRLRQGYGGPPKLHAKAEGSYHNDPKGSCHTDPPAVEARLDAIYTHARRALYATLDEGVLNDVSPHHVPVRTLAVDRDDYLAHPPRGEQLREQDARVVSRLYSSRRPQVQLVISDGLNANALNEHLRAVLPPLRYALAQAGLHVGETDVVIENGRVRAGYHVGDLVDATVIVHFIGERPGTGLNTLSAYLTYGRDAAGQSRWGFNLNHSWTTAVCGIHPQGRPPAAAVDGIVRSVQRMLEERRSGVALHARPRG
jgi:ethanolamine ammonia-lyase large subunit